VPISPENFQIDKSSDGLLSADSKQVMNSAAIMSRTVVTSDERQSISQFPAGQVYSHSINKVGDFVHQSFRNNIFVTYGIGGHYPTAVFRDGGEDYPRSREPIRPVTPPEEQDA
jgi:hypothetical protein